VARSAGASPFKFCSFNDATRTFAPEPQPEPELQPEQQQPQLDKQGTRSFLPEWQFQNDGNKHSPKEKKVTPATGKNSIAQFITSNQWEKNRNKSTEDSAAASSQPESGANKPGAIFGAPSAVAPSAPATPQRTRSAGGPAKVDGPAELGASPVRLGRAGLEFSWEPTPPAAGAQTEAEPPGPNGPVFKFGALVPAAVAAAQTECISPGFKFGGQPASPADVRAPGPATPTRRKAKGAAVAGSPIARGGAFPDFKLGGTAAEIGPQVFEEARRALKAAEGEGALKAADTLRARGNAAYQRQEYRQAQQLYSSAISAVEKLGGAAQPSESGGGGAEPPEPGPALLQSPRRAAALLATCYSNRATARRQLGQLGAALADCRAARGADPANRRAVLKQAGSLLLLVDVGGAEACLDEGLLALSVPLIVYIENPYVDNKLQ
jgi:tetratricopeptide (TPR) repeat protein